MALRDMEYDRPRFEQGEVAFFIGGNLPERMQLEMRGVLHLTERKKANLVGLTDFFKRPANSHVTRQSPAPVGRAFKGGDSGGHSKAPGECVSIHGNTAGTTNFDMRHSSGVVYNIGAISATYSLYL